MFLSATIHDAKHALMPTLLLHIWHHHNIQMLADPVGKVVKDEAGNGPIIKILGRSMCSF
jgi:hypothetical protein